MEKKQKYISILVIMVLVFAIIPHNTLAASAATSSEVYKGLAGKLPIVTHAAPLSGQSKVYAYTDSTLKAKQTGYWIATFSDQIVITKISSDGKAVYVTYPSSITSSGYRSLWFASDDILGIGTVGVSSYTASGSSTTYCLASGSSVKSYGSIDSKDSCVKLGSCKVGGVSYYPTVYPIASATVNKIGGIKHKLALSKNKGASAPAPVPAAQTSSGLLFPLKGAIKTSSDVKTNGYCCDYYTGGKKAVYAPADGTAAFEQAYTIIDGKKTLTSYGNFIEFTSADNNYYIKMAHLSSFNDIALTIPSTQTKQQSGSTGKITLKTKKVKKGELLGYSGHTGYAFGDHLHIEAYKKGVAVNPKNAFTAW